jgi:lipopolysaccharide transport system permease protein
MISLPQTLLARPVPGCSPSSETGNGPASLLTIIDARRGYRWLNLSELWRYRELLYFLSWRDLKVRYRQAVLGVAWAIVQPLATMIVFSLFFARATTTASPELPYSLFVFAGLLPWFFLSNSITAAGQSVVGSQNLVTKVYFPRLLIPTGAVLVGIVDFLIAFCLLVPFSFYYGKSPGWGLLWLPIVLMGLLIVSLGIGTLLAALTVAYRDFRYVVPFMVQLWLFATPSIYIQSDAISSDMPRWLLAINPAYGLIACFRSSVLGVGVDASELAISLAGGLGLLLVGNSYFHRVEGSFADII